MYIHVATCIWVVALSSGILSRFKSRFPQPHRPIVSCTDTVRVCMYSCVQRTSIPNTLLSTTQVHVFNTHTHVSLYPSISVYVVACNPGRHSRTCTHVYVVACNPGRHSHTCTHVYVVACNPGRHSHTCTHVYIIMYYCSQASSALRTFS